MSDGDEKTPKVEIPDQGRRSLFGLLSVLGGSAALAACASNAAGAPAIGSLAQAETGSGVVTYADTFADLKSLNPGAQGSNSILILKGYWGPGDGGGGAFYWDATQAIVNDDGGTIVAPTGAVVGCWMRLFEGQFSVRSFGAKGDGTTDDTLAIQRAIDAAQRTGIRAAKVVFPAGSYVVGATASSGLVVNKLALLLEGVAASESQKARLLVAGGNDGITIGRTIVAGAVTDEADGTIVRHLAIEPLGGVGSGRRTGATATGRHGVVVAGAASVHLEDLDISFMGGDGIWITAPADGVHNADLWSIRNCSVFQNGANGLHLAGGDANAGLCELLNATGNEGWGILDESFLGNTYIACHTNANGLVFEAGPLLPDSGSFRITAVANYSTFVGCYAELNQNPPDLAASLTVLVVGGNLAGLATNAQRVGYTNSLLQFRSQASVIHGTDNYSRSVELDTAQLSTHAVAASVTYTPLEPAKVYRNASGVWEADRYVNQWGLQRIIGSDETSNNPNLTNLDRTWVMQGSNGIPGFPAGLPTPFGWTDRAHPQGPGLFFLGNPRINQPALWTYRISLGALPPGGTTITTSALDWIRNMNPALMDATFSLVADAGADFAEPIDVVVGPYQITPDSSVRVRLFNLTSSTIRGLTLVAHFERYKNWFDSGY
jgi:hypothetical protein